MDWVQIFVLLFGNLSVILPLWLWSRSESIAEMKHMDQKTNSILEAIRQDIKDFHGRLCAIEEKNKGKK